MKHTLCIQPDVAQQGCKSCIDYGMKEGIEKYRIINQCCHLDRRPGNGGSIYSIYALHPSCAPYTRSRVLFKIKKCQPKRSGMGKEPKGLAPGKEVDGMAAIYHSTRCLWRTTCRISMFTMALCNFPPTQLRNCQ